MPAAATADEDLVRLALEAGLLTTDVLMQARAGLAGGGRLYEALVQGGWLDASAVAAALAKRFGMETVALAPISIPPAVRDLVPRALAWQHTLVPVALADGVLKLAVADPLDHEGTDAVAHLLPFSIQPVIAPRPEIEEALARLYPPSPWTSAAAPPAGGPVGAASAETDEGDAPIIRLVEALIAEGVRRGASDIHVEPLERQLRLRYRVDGVLVVAEAPPQRLQQAIISRLKILAGLSIAEKRQPQDGRLAIVVDGRPLDLRVSSLPTAHGESIVMRVLDPESLRRGLPELGLGDADRATFERLIAQPDGILLVTGPTGSGKTTTLYSCLHAINRPDCKIITVEDPVEYQLGGVNQVPVRADIGMTFASALRAMLRQAPNVIMVGEIRDRETAEMAVHASLTGHLVLSTLHTNDAPGAVTRLVDIGVRPFLVATALRGVMAQRLVRRICLHCADAAAPTGSELRQLGLDPGRAAGATFRRGRGCGHCHGTGFRGRLGLFEIMVMDDRLRSLVHAGASAAKLRENARAAGMRSLREDGIAKVIAGLTTVEEVVSITLGDSS